MWTPLATAALLGRVRLLSPFPVGQMAGLGPPGPVPLMLFPRAALVIGFYG